LQHLQFSLQRNDENLKDKIQKTSELLIRQIDSLSQMAEEFSSFAKMPEPKLERVNLVQVVSDAVLLLGKESDMPIEWKFASDDVHVQADPLQLGRVFTNILKNAIQSIPEGRTGEIAAELKLKDKVLIDSQMMHDVFCNPKFVKNISKAVNSLHLSTNGGGMKISRKADVPGLYLDECNSTVYCDTDEITNILSFKN
jgi:nitrogen fixation/metabolism regulation signal transduction histidine kinase